MSMTRPRPLPAPRAPVQVAPRPSPAAGVRCAWILILLASILLGSSCSLPRPEWITASEWGNA